MSGWPPNSIRTKWSANAMARTVTPIDMASCGIQIGVASWPWDMSWSLLDQYVPLMA